MKVSILMLMMTLFIFSCSGKNEESEKAENGNDNTEFFDGADEEADNLENIDDDDEGGDKDEYADLDIPEESKYILKNGFQIDSIDNLDDFSDLQHLKDILKDKKIIMVGDGHHGAAETKKYMTRIIAFIYKEFGATSVLWETCSINGYFIDNFIQNGDKSSLASLLSYQKTGITATYDFYNVFRDIRKINGHEIAKGPLSFLGVDVCPIPAMVREYLRKYLQSCNKIEILDEFEKEFDTIFIPYETDFFEVCEDLIVVIEKLVAEINGAEKDLINNCSEEKYNNALNVAYDFLNAHKFYCFNDDQIREDAIFKNVENVLKKETGKIVIAYGQAHVQNQTFTSGGQNMRTLSQLLHDNYDSLGIYTIGTDFSEGTVSWTGVDDDGEGFYFYEYDLPKIDETYLSYFFSKLEKDFFYLDWHDVDKDNFDLWLNRNYFLTSNYRFNPLKAYDGFFYIDKVTPLTCCVTNEGIENWD